MKLRRSRRRHFDHGMSGYFVAFSSRPVPQQMRPMICDQCHERRFAFAYSLVRGGFMDLYDFATLGSWLTIGFWSAATFATIYYLESFRRHVKRSTTTDAPRGFAEDAWPEALVIMSLRGGDMSLCKTLNGLASQDYPRYRIRLVIDNPSDEVDEVVKSWQQTHPNAPLQVEYLGRTLPNCTLKCSSVHQVLRSTGPEVGVIVLVDGDSDPYPLWLHDAVAPFADPRVGGVTGNRWYFPRAGGLAAWCRFAFTAFSLPEMWRRHFSWGGTLAIRREIACSDQFLTAFARTPTEEQTCFEILPTLGRSMYFASRLIQWNSESADFAGAETHLFRQLAWSRLFYPSWGSILFGTGAMACAVALSLLLAAAAIVAGKLLWTFPLVAALVFAGSIVVALERLHETLRQHVFSRQGRLLPHLTPPRALELFAGLLCTLGVYLFALVRAQFAAAIVWRGIRYLVMAGGKIRMTGYRPWKRPIAKPQEEAIPVRPLSVE
ncbi:MAG: hypothetical protein C0483_07895 [Pirellula sp.]|nr:hypothetical protein [Pirellula sp.]